ncbi:peptidase C15 [Methylobacterium sp. BTF04]|uniref:pyroglutamyl-peptidase I family protein n=1 Tax=Methylobacterium sp. BTF04 TaxID=2708300 RepID=UPI0013D5387A|nr:peptidase C15 [Methylobacterium sp. BTF04]NEU13189.1 peptidase C15 [Methylobacterium sp. BTF04]
MSGRHVLITGFGPFPGVPVNPSAMLARRLGASPRLRTLTGGQVRVRILTTAYRAIADELTPALAEGPAAVLMIGVAGRAKRVRVEVRARNRVSRLFPDASGRIATGLTLDADGPDERRAPVAAKALAALCRNGVAAIRSQDAGRYLCNASYYWALAEGVPVLFLHIPPVPRKARPGRPKRRPGGAALEAGCVALIGQLLRHGRLPSHR